MWYLFTNWTAVTCWPFITNILTISTPCWMHKCLNIWIIICILKLNEFYLFAIEHTSVELRFKDLFDTIDLPNDAYFALRRNKAVETSNIHRKIMFIPEMYDGNRKLSGRIIIYDSILSQMYFVFLLQVMLFSIANNSKWAETWN